MTIGNSIAFLSGEAAATGDRSRSGAPGRVLRSGAPFTFVEIALDFLYNCKYGAAHGQNPR